MTDDTASSGPFRAAFDPACTRWETFNGVRAGDQIDLWGPARSVVSVVDVGEGRVRILVHDGSGHELATVPGREGTWRAPRPGERCPAAHPEDPEPCDGPVTVTVLDSQEGSVNGCVTHAARLLASLGGGRARALPGAPPVDPLRALRQADRLPPYPWLVDAPRTEPSQRSRADNRRAGQEG